MGSSCSRICQLQFCHFNDDSANREDEPLLAAKEREAVNMLVDFFENRTGVSFYEGEPLHALSTLAYSDIYHLQLSAATAFSEVSEVDVRPVSRETIEPILYLLQSPHIDVQHGASAALGNLAVNGENKILIVKMGGLEPLIRQMLSPNVDAQINSVGCITNLATADENKPKIAKSGALIPLTRLARSRDIRVQRNAAGALLNMTHSSENRQQLINAGAVPVLVSLLASEDPDIQYYVTTALSNIAVDASGRRRLLDTEPGLVEALIRLVESSSLRVQCQAGLTLRNLASDDEYQIQIVEKGGLEPLLHLVQSAYIPLIVSASACLRNLSIHPDNEALILRAGFLPYLVNMVELSESPEAQCHAISALRNLAANSDADCEPFAQAGLFDRMLRVLANQATDETVKSEMVAALTVFAINEALRPHILSSGFLEVLVPLITRNMDNVEMQCNACVTVGSLASKGDSECFVKAWDRPEGGLQSYLALFLSSDKVDSSLRSIAVWTVLIFIETGSQELISLIVRHPSIVKSIEEIAHASMEADAQLMNDGYVEQMDQGGADDEDYYDRIGTFAQQAIAILQDLDY